MYENILNLIEFFERHKEIERLDGKYVLDKLPEKVKDYDVKAYRVPMGVGIKEIIRIDIQEKENG